MTAGRERALPIRSQEEGLIEDTRNRPIGMEGDQGSPLRPRAKRRAVRSRGPTTSSGSVQHVEDPPGRDRFPDRVAGEQRQEPVVEGWEVVLRSVHQTLRSCQWGPSSFEAGRGHGPVQGYQVPPFRT